MKQERSYHSSTVLGTSLYVYGGSENSFERLVNLDHRNGDLGSYWEILMIYDKSIDRQLMVPMKDSEEILIFEKASQ